MTQQRASLLTIGKVAQRSRVSADSLRYYEREGLVRPASKSEAGYRLYSEEAIRRIGFIKHAQACGFSLAEIRELLELRATDKACCGDMYRVAVQKKLQLEHKVEALTAMVAALARLIESCSRDRKSLDECPILGALEAGVTTPNDKMGRRRSRRGGGSGRM